MKTFLLSILLFLPIGAIAQDNGKYLAGTIPVAEGKVVFSTELQASPLSQDQVFETVLAWASNRFKSNGKFNARLLYTNKEEGQIAAAGEEYIVFSSSALSLDRTRIYYQLFVSCHPGKCNVEMTRIRYLYDEERDGGEKYTAEEWITDDIALNKSKTKLTPIAGKFRRKTIDLKDDLFKSVQAAVEEKLIAMGAQPAPVTPETVVAAVTTVPVATPAQPAVPAKTTVQAVPVPTVQEATPSTTPAATTAIEEQIKQATTMTVTAGNDEQFRIGKECWGGFGKLFGKEVSFCIIDTQKTMGNLLLLQSQTYTISFYRQGQSDPCVTIKCKKLAQQTLSGEEAKNMNPNNDGTKTYNMYVGEVIK